MIIKVIIHISVLPKDNIKIIHLMLAPRKQLPLPFSFNIRKKLDMSTNCFR